MENNEKFQLNNKENSSESILKKKYDYYFNIMLLGDFGTGKTSFLLRYYENYFRTDFISGIGIDFWDQIQTRFRPNWPNYCRRAHAFFLVYDITNRVTFEFIRCIHQNILRLKPTPLVILIGAKSDIDNNNENSNENNNENQQGKLIRQVSYEEGENLAQELNLTFFMECSSKTGENVDVIVKKTLDLLVNRYHSDSPPTFPLEYHPPRSCCCGCVLL